LNEALSILQRHTLLRIPRNEGLLGRTLNLLAGDLAPSKRPPAMQAAYLWASTRPERKDVFHSRSWLSYLPCVYDLSCG
jgi:hypothetical protein